MLMVNNLVGFGARRATALTIAELFNATAYTGNGTSQTVTTGADADTVQIKNRSTALTGNGVFDTVRGATKQHATNSQSQSGTNAQSLTAFSATGFSVGSDGDVNENTIGHIAYSWRMADNFHHVSEVAHTNGVETTIDLSALGTVGEVWVKEYDADAVDWWAWHRSLTAGTNLRVNTTAAESATNAYLSVSGTTLSIAAGQASGNYMIYAWAHDSAATGKIQCLSFTTDGSGAGSIDPGWAEGSQFLCLKSSIGGTGNWEYFDTARTSGWTGDEARLLFNTTGAETSVARLAASGTAINITGLSASRTYVCRVVRAP